MKHITTYEFNHQEIIDALVKKHNLSKVFVVPAGKGKQKKAGEGQFRLTSYAEEDRFVLEIVPPDDAIPTNT